MFVRRPILSSKYLHHPPKAPAPMAEQSLPVLLPSALGNHQAASCVYRFATGPSAPRRNHAICGPWGLASPQACLRFMNIVACVHTSPKVSWAGVTGHSSAGAQAPSQCPTCQLMGLESPSPWLLGRTSRAGKDASSPRPGVTGWLEPHFCPPVYLCTTGPRGLMSLPSPRSKQVAQMPMWRQSRQRLPEASLGMARILNNLIRGLTRLSHAGLGRARRGSWPRQALGGIHSVVGL